MRILYVAKHGPQDNQDEDSISYALEQLGHQVIRLHEKTAPGVLQHSGAAQGCDFLLFHHWMNVECIQNFKGLPKVFWTFDLMRSKDEWLGTRINYRDKWVADLLPHIVAGFCTDGDCVAEDKTGKLYHLMQGADERYAGYGTPGDALQPIIFTGTIRHGQQRAQHITELQARYGHQFAVIGNGNPSGKKHGRALADVFANTKIVIAPDAPCTNLYTSNRVYLTTGLGGFLLHPYSGIVAKHYPRGTPNGQFPCPETKVDMYESRQELYGMIDYYLTHDKEREEIRRAGHEWTMAHHTYRHRCEELVKAVKERL